MTEKRKIGLNIIKVIIVIIAWIYVGYKIRSYHLTLESITAFRFSLLQILKCIIVLILMIVNWSIEAKKWQYSLQSFIRISFIKSFQAVLSGTTVGIISPNRAGEPFGRASYINSHFRQEAVSAGIICSIAQFTATVLAGCLALALYCNQQGYFSNHLFSYILALIALQLVLFLYFNSNNLGKVVQRIPYIKRFELFSAHFKTSSKAYLFVILLYSIIRYSIFVLQFFLILEVFTIEISFTHTCIAVGMIYFVTTLIPTTTLAELGIRCSSSVYFIGIYCNKPILIVTASVVLWLINVSIPAIVGSLFYLPWFKDRSIRL